MFHALIDFILVFISIPFCSTSFRSVPFVSNFTSAAVAATTSAQHPQNGYSQLI
jgi:hypothetical protein